MNRRTADIVGWAASLQLLVFGEALVLEFHCHIINVALSVCVCVCGDEGCCMTTCISALFFVEVHRPSGKVKLDS